MDHAHHVIVAEDDPTEFELLEAALKRLRPRLKLSWVKDGAELLDSLAGRGLYAGGPRAPRPRLILLDLAMPGMDGRAALRGLRALPQARAIPRVVRSGSELRDEELAELYDLGAAAFVRKSGNWNGYLTELSALMVFWLDVAVVPRACGALPAG